MRSGVFGEIMIRCQAKQSADTAFLEKFLDDDESLNELIRIKMENKQALADYLKHTQNEFLDPESIFDVQVKRLHEYKRQLLNILNVMYIYNRIVEDPTYNPPARTFIFGAKAASGYRRAKSIIKLINTVAERINNDRRVRGLLRVVFVENYRVSVAEKIFPAADVSEQISTAGLEASGTSNMKFMANGALTLGTMDGANIEIFEEAGKENGFVFGLLTEEIKKKVSLERIESSKVSCQFCGLLLSFANIEEHESMCGARTQQCGHCKKTMLMKDLRNNQVSYFC